MKAKTSGGPAAGRGEKPDSRRPSAVREAADALRRDAIDREDGELLGAEEDLIRRYRVSRPTLRQAAALVAQENLLRVKRGVGGGYFASRPDSRAVAHMAAVYLRTRHTQVTEVIRAVEPIRIELAKLAAEGNNEAAREEMRQFLAREREINNAELRFRDFLRTEREFGRILGEMSGNKVISLFLLILYDFSGMLGRDEDLYINRPDRVDEYREKRNRLAEALIDGDAELALVAAKRCAMNASEWVLEDLGIKSAGSAFGHLAGSPPAVRGAKPRRPVKERNAAARLTARAASGTGRALTLEDRETVGAAMAAFAAPLSESAFANLYLFRDVHGYRLAQDAALPHLTGATYDGEDVVVPLFDLAAADPAAVRAIAGGRRLYPVPEHRAPGVDGLYAASANEADSDYVYEAARMGALAGLKTRRQQADRFEAAFAPEILPVASAAEATMALSVLDQWLADVAKPWAATDYAACREALTLREPLGLFGLMVLAQGRPGGFVLASEIAPDMAAIHFAKGLRSLDGVFPWLFRQFAREHPRYALINFEQDLGHAGFRQAKRSYAPVRLQKKLRLRPRG